jgi:hypothetical protein
MTLIKILLIVSFLGMLLWAFRNRATVGLRAGIRMGAVGLTVAAIASIINPNISTRVANFLGVGRGTDLLLYVLIVVFAATSVGTYFRFRAQELRIVEIVRALAIRDAVSLNGSPGSLTKEVDPHQSRRQ